VPRAQIRSDGGRLCELVACRLDVLRDRLHLLTLGRPARGRGRRAWAATVGHGYLKISFIATATMPPPNAAPIAA
jgi:hypothetical protein